MSVPAPADVTVKALRAEFEGRIAALEATVAELTEARGTDESRAAEVAGLAARLAAVEGRLDAIDNRPREPPPIAA